MIKGQKLKMLVRGKVFAVHKFHCNVWRSTHIDTNSCDNTIRIFGFNVTTSQDVTICINKPTTQSISTTSYG